MLEDIFLQLDKHQTERCFFFNDPESGLRAILVLDNLTLGPAAGGIRISQYTSTEEAFFDATRLARAMTIKCSLAGIDAGGGKAVVLQHDGMVRTKAFEKLGEYIHELGGIFHTAGDLGTTAGDLIAVARKTTHVETDDKNLAEAVAVGVISALEACARRKSKDSLAGLRILIQGCGAIGSAVAKKLSQLETKLLLTDIDLARVRRLALEVGGEVVSADNWPRQELDIFCPCAIGGVLTTPLAMQLNAWAVCGAANNVIAESRGEQILTERGILFVPDVVASAGAVIEGVGKSIMRLSDCSNLINRIGETADAVLDEAFRSQKLPSEIAKEHAYQRIAAAKKPDFSF